MSLSVITPPYTQVVKKHLKELGLNPDLLPSKAAVLTTTIHGFINPNVYALDITAKAKALFRVHCHQKVQNVWFS